MSRRGRDSAWKRYEMVQKMKNDDKQQKLLRDIIDEKKGEEKKDINETKERFILGTEHNSTMQYNRNSGYRNGRSYWRNRGYSGSGSGSGFRSGSGSDSRGAGNKNNDFLLTLGFSEGMGREYMLQNKVFYGRVNLYKRRETEKAYLAKIYAKPVNGNTVVAETWVPKSIIAKRSAGWIMNKLNEVLSQPNAQGQPNAQSQNKTQPNTQNKSQDQGKGSETPANKKE